MVRSSSSVGSSSSPRFSFSSPKASPTMPRIRLSSTKSRYAGTANEYTHSVAYSTFPRMTDLSAKRRPTMSSDEPSIISKWKLKPFSKDDSASSVVPSMTCPIIVDRNSEMKKMMRKCSRSSEDRDSVRTVRSRCLWKSTIFSDRSTISNSEMPEMVKYEVRISLSCKIVIIVCPSFSMPLSSVGSSQRCCVSAATAAPAKPSLRTAATRASASV